MKILIPVLTALTALCASWCAPAIATQTSQGSRVLVPPLISKGAVKSKQPMIVLRLPTQAGKVSKMVTTNLVAKGPSWIAKGNNYYSLCVPNRRMVACAPIVATSVMQDIEVGAMAGPKGEPLLTFKITPSTKQAPKRIRYAINYFLTRTNMQVAHFDRKAVSYAPRPWEESLRVGSTSNAIDDTGGSGGTCTYDDEGGMDCSGGGGVGGGGNEGGGGSGYNGNENDYDTIPGPASTPNEPTGQCGGNCNYPSGNNNGDPDPCIDPNGNRICSDPSQIPQVPITGEYPAAPACDAQPDGSIVCGMQAAGTIPGMPPVWIPPGPITNWNAPVFPQSWCNSVHALCSRGQEPSDKNGAPPVPDDYVGAQGEQSGTSASGNRHTSGPLAPENGGTGDAQKDFDKLTGGTGKKFPDGDSRANQPGVLIGPPVSNYCETTS